MSTKQATGFFPSRMSGDDFVRHLADGKQAVQRRFTGWVKVSEHAGCVAFGPFGSCTFWVDLPTVAIDHVDVIGQANCDDHQHPVVTLELKSEGDASILAIAQLLAQVQLLKRGATQRTSSSRMMSGIPGDTGCPGKWNSEGGWECSDGGGGGGGGGEGGGGFSTGGGVPCTACEESYAAAQVVCRSIRDPRMRQACWSGAMAAYALCLATCTK